MTTVLAFVRLSRPIFLLGGFVLYGLGAAVSRFDGFTISLSVYLLGQIAITSAQLMTHYFNEVYDFAADSNNLNRTFWSGGSGVLPSGQISVQTAIAAAQATLVVSVIAMIAAAIVMSNSAAILLHLVIIFGAWAYSTPPLRLLSTSWGGFSAALIVSGLTPAFAYTLQSGTLNVGLIWIFVPLIAIQFAMLVIFDIPDRESDASADKRTVVVRLGVQRAGRIAIAAIIFAFGVLTTRVVFADNPGIVALAALPLAAYVIWRLYRTTMETQKQYGSFTFAGVSLYTLTSFAMLVEYSTAI